MTEQEAIDRIRYRIATASEITGNGLDGKAFEDMELAIKALEKQVPMKPHGISCGSCNYVLIMSHDLYCPRCGQKVNWSD